MHILADVAPGCTSLFSNGKKNREQHKAVQSAFLDFTNNHTMKNDKGEGDEEKLVRLRKNQGGQKLRSPPGLGVNGGWVSR